MLLSILGYLLQIILYLVLIIAILLIALILIPYQYRVTGEKNDETSVEGAILWLFGGIKVNFRYTNKEKATTILTLFKWIKFSFQPNSTNRRAKKATATTAKQHITTKQAKTSDAILTESMKTDIKMITKKNTEAHNSEALKKEKKSHPSFAKELLNPKIIKKALLTLKKVLKHCQPQTLSLSAKVGFSDPMVTGLLYALLSQFYPFCQKYSVQLQPVFDEEGLEGNFLIGGRLWFPTLLYLILGFLLAKPVRSIYITKLFNKFRKIKGGPHYVPTT
ncbi:DUF2953 domain-containing protein [Desulfitobacterium sp. THU1]|uniref:DUF2953 domain-containing protein n=1 Tax=Desulfitobacterium sp. THU1 TaxID=3138072 RepID=UPI00311E99CD